MMRATMVATVKAGRAVKPLVYLRPTAQAISKRAAKMR